MGIRPLDVVALGETYRSTTPFPHFSIEELLEDAFAREVAASYPSFEEADRLGRQFDAVNEHRKIQITDSASGLTNSSAALGILRLHETDHGKIDANENSVANAGERQIGFQHGFAFSALFGDLHLEPRKTSTHEEWNAIQQ